MSFLSRGLALATLILLSACAAKPVPAPAPPAPAPAAPETKPEPKTSTPAPAKPAEPPKPQATAAPAAKGNASVTGKIVFTGTPPEVKEIDMSGVKECAAHHADPVPEETVVVGAGGALKNVVVYVSDGLPAGQTYTPPAEAAVLDQKGCMYEPHVLPVMVGQKLVVKNDETGQEEEHLIATGKHIIVQPGDLVHKGQHLTEGAADPHEILEILGPSALYDFLISQVQEVYRLQGVRINDKHIGVIVRQMLQKIRVTDPGETTFLEGETVDRLTFREENERVLRRKGEPATSEPVLLGITKASLSTRSFFSAASFQETTRILTDAAIRGARDELIGLKENIIIGHLIPAGTGHYRYVDLEIQAPEGFEPPPAPEPVEVVPEAILVGAGDDDL